MRGSSVALLILAQLGFGNAARRHNLVTAILEQQFVQKDNLSTVGVVESLESSASDAANVVEDDANETEGIHGVDNAEKKINNMGGLNGHYVAEERLMGTELEFTDSEAEKLDSKSNSVTECAGGSWSYVTVTAMAVHACTQIPWPFRKDDFTFKVKIDGREHDFGRAVDKMDQQPTLGPDLFGVWEATKQICLPNQKKDVYNFQADLKVQQNGFMFGPYECGGWQTALPMQIPCLKESSGEWPVTDKVSAGFRVLWGGGPCETKKAKLVDVEEDTQETVVAEVSAHVSSSAPTEVAHDSAPFDPCAKCSDDLCFKTAGLYDIRSVHAVWKDVCSDQGLCKNKCPPESWRRCRDADIHCLPEGKRSLFAQKIAEIEEQMKQAKEHAEAAAKVWIANREARKAREKTVKQAAKECAFYKTQTSCGFKQKKNSNKVEVEDDAKYEQCKAECEDKTTSVGIPCKLYGLGDVGEIGFINCAAFGNCFDDAASSVVVDDTACPGYSSNTKWMNDKLQGVLPRKCQNRWKICDPAAKPEERKLYCDAARDHMKRNGLLDVVKNMSLPKRSRYHKSNPRMVSQANQGQAVSIQRGATCIVKDDV